MNDKVVEITNYRKKRNENKRLQGEKSYEEIISEKYAEDLTNEFKQLLNEEANDKK